MASITVTSTANMASVTVTATTNPGLVLPSGLEVELVKLSWLSGLPCTSETSVFYF